MQARRPQRASARRTTRIDFSKCEVRFPEFKVVLSACSPSRTSLTQECALQTTNLQKYRKHYKLDGSATMPKEELVDMVTKHFSSQVGPSTSRTACTIAATRISRTTLY